MSNHSSFSNLSLDTLELLRLFLDLLHVSIS